MTSEKIYTKDDIEAACALAVSAACTVTVQTFCTNCAKELRGPLDVGAQLATHRELPAAVSETATKKETREEMRQRFEAWHKVAYPLFNPDRDTTMKHALWTAWQVANG